MVTLLFDCIRAPYDWANILQATIAVGDCQIYVTGNSIRHDHHKVIGKVGSWSKSIRKNGLPNIPIFYIKSFKECLEALKAKKFVLIGTSPYSQESFYDLDLKDDNLVIVFGTESSGLTKEKMTMMDKMVKLPMTSNLDFMTLSVIVPVIVYEIKRQQGVL